jgi:hypothetical protein
MESGEASSVRERTLVAIDAAFRANGVSFEKRGGIISLALNSLRAALPSKKGAKLRGI